MPTPCSADAEPRLDHHGEHGFQAAMRRSDKPAGRAALVAEVHHGGRAAVDAKLVLDLRANHVVAGAERSIVVDEEFWDEKQRYAFRAAGRVGKPGEHQVNDVVR